MISAPPTSLRELNERKIQADLAVIGGGLAGTCCAITAARLGLKVALVQDRPVLGGNASSEVRLWVLGATSHMYSNNRWAREGGVIDEVLLDNLHRNPEGNALIFDTILLEKVVAESNITLLLNTAVYEAEKNTPSRISGISAFCSQNSTRYRIEAPFFADASGDGVIGFLSGAAFRMGAEAKDEFGELFAPDREFGELLGHTIYFYSKDTGRPVRFVPPAFALRDIEKTIPGYRNFKAGDHGCSLWWIEYGGRLDTIHDSEAIKWELWQVVYGVWNYIKNSGKFPEADTLTLEWVGTIPGKRESRRFEGDYILRQQDVIEQREHPDAVAFGGWALDLHPSDGVYSNRPPCTHEHPRGIYQIPYRCLYSRNIENLFLAGRIMSASHVAFGSTRVMATLAHCGQAIGHAAALCRRNSALPRDLSRGKGLGQLQLALLRSGQHIPRKRLEDPEDIVQEAVLTASSEYTLAQLAPNGPPVDLRQDSWAQMVPARAGAFPKVHIRLNALEPCQIDLELRCSFHPEHHSPTVLLAAKSVRLTSAGEQELSIDFEVHLERECYVFICLRCGPPVLLATTEQRVTGLLSLTHRPGRNQEDKPALGIIGFEKWTPVRRPRGQNLALRFEPPIDTWQVENIRNGVQRPTCQSNAWVADPEDPCPGITLNWRETKCIVRMELFFDTDFDHALESVLMGHPETEVPFCVSDYRVTDQAGRIVASKEGNHQTRNTIVFPRPVVTDVLHLEILKMCGSAPPAVFEVRCYEQEPDPPAAARDAT